MTNYAKKDYRLEWQDWKKLDCACRIRIYDGQAAMAGREIVIATDINVGQSVTNECENIATLACRENHINILDLVFIEHYEEEENAPRHRPNDPIYAEHFDRVKFTWNERDGKFQNPKWSRFSHEEVKAIIGTDEIFTRES